ncbi:MmpS family transport accessory protein [Streptomyces sp. NPDC088358]|uniref:MmpS family transport accessory protein n=1 Tax=Streptomyces sp. NPDC088358 TaxID=3365857 RepID=UPI0038068DD9
MSHNQPPPSGPSSWGQVPPPPPMPPQPTGRPKWARKRIAIPAALVILFIGVGIGSSGDDQKTAADAKPAPRVTVTETAKGNAKAAPAPTVTVTKTAKPAAVKAKPTKKEPAAPKDQVVFKVWGSAPAGVDITYGSDSDSIQGHGLPMTKTLTLKDDAMYYNVTAQLQGGGDVRCSVTVDGKTKTGHAAGGYNICNAQLSGGLFGDWS